MLTKNTSRRKEFVDAALRVIDGCTECLIELEDIEMARDFWSRFPVYNNMDRDGILRLIDTIDQTMPRRQYFDGNQINGKHAVQLHVGNEGSAVMYLRLAKYITRGRDHEVMSAWTAIQAAAELAGADEIDDESTEDTWVFRIWWD